MLLRNFLRLCALATAAGAAALSGCASSGSTFGQISAGMPGLMPGHGRIYFLRSPAVFSTALQPEITLNGQAVGTSRPGGFFLLQRPAGTYAASTAAAQGQVASFDLRAGQTRYVRTSASMGLLGGRIVAEVETEENALAELPSLRYTGNERSAPR